MAQTPDPCPPTADAAAFWSRSDDDVLADFVAATAHDTGKTALSRKNQLRAALRRYARQHGREVPRLRDVITDAQILGAVLAADGALNGNGKVGKGTIRNARAAFQALIAAVPPPPGFTREGLRQIHFRARAATERVVGLRRLLAAGRSESQRRCSVPTADEIGRVIALLRDQRPPGHVAAALLGFLYLTGARIGATLGLTRDDLLVMPDDLTWVYLHEKARRDRRPLRVRPEQAALALAWRQLAPGAPLWMVRGRPVREDDVSHWIRDTCHRAGIATFTPHDLRRAFAGDLLPALGLRGAMRAGGWLAEPVFEEYVDAGRRRLEDDGAPQSVRTR